MKNRFHREKELRISIPCKLSHKGRGGKGKSKGVYNPSLLLLRIFSPILERSVIDEDKH